MTYKRHQTSRTLSRGQSQRVSLDPATRQRSSWAIHAIEQRIGARATTSTIIRRAVDFYVQHLEGLINLPETHRKLQFERRGVMQANLGSDLGIPLDALRALPVAKLSAIREAHRKATPKVIESLKADLARWEKQRQAGMPLDDVEEGDFATFCSI